MLIFLMLVYGLTLTAAADLLRSTYLLGSFMAGFSFVKVQGAAELWEHQVGPFEGALSGFVCTWTRLSFAWLTLTSTNFQSTDSSSRP